MDEEYTKIENHIRFARHLNEIDRKGKHIIYEFQAKKSKTMNKRTNTYNFESATSRVYKNILHCLSLKRLRLYFYLQYFLDELLFFEAQNSSIFYIEDAEYNISKLYFGQDEWIADQSYYQKYEFYENTAINIHEAMYLVCYLKEFDLFLIDLEQYIKPFKEIKRIKTKLRYTIQKIRQRHSDVWKVLLGIINQNFSQE